MINDIIKGKTWAHVYSNLKFKKNNYKHKLNEKKVKRIRFLYLKGNITQQALANIYNVARETIGDIIRKETWKSVK